MVRWKQMESMVPAASKATKGQEEQRSGQRQKGRRCLTILRLYAVGFIYGVFLVYGVRPASSGFHGGFLPVHQGSGFAGTTAGLLQEGRQGRSTFTATAAEFAPQCASENRGEETCYQEGRGPVATLDERSERYHQTAEIEARGEYGEAPEGVEGAGAERGGDQSRQGERRDCSYRDRGGRGRHRRAFQEQPKSTSGSSSGAGECSYPTDEDCVGTRVSKEVGRGMSLCTDEHAAADAYAHDGSCWTASPSTGHGISAGRTDASSRMQCSDPWDFWDRTCESWALHQENTGPGSYIAIFKAQGRQGDDEHKAARNTWSSSRRAERRGLRMIAPPDPEFGTCMVPKGVHGRFTLRSWPTEWHVIMDSMCRFLCLSVGELLVFLACAVYMVLTHRPRSRRLVKVQLIRHSKPERKK